MPQRTLWEFSLIFFTVDFLRYLLAASILFGLVYWMKNGVLKNRHTFRKEPQWRQIRFEFLHSIKTLLVYTVFGMVGHTALKHGMNLVYMDLKQYSLTYLAFSILVLIFVQDTFFYWTHRWMHHPKLFRHFHAIHHQSHDPTPFSAYSFNWTEAAVHASFVLAMTFVLPLHPLAIAVFMVFQISMNVIGHCSYELFPKWWIHSPILDIKNTVTHHSLHHHRPNSNFALYFTYWDRWMGTEDPLYHQKFRENTTRVSH